LQKNALSGDPTSTKLVGHF